jgi:hypothetical protein
MWVVFIELGIIIALFAIILFAWHRGKTKK